MDTKISMIIPVYNIEKSIKFCLDSVVSQTFLPHEVIIINDGSIDKTGIICDEYEEKYDFIKVFHQENKGVSFSRNFGINKANGDYLAFVDGDDILSPFYLEELHYVIESHMVDLAICSYTSNLNEIKQEQKNIENKDVQVIEHDLAMEKFLVSNEIDGYLWNKLWKKKIIMDNALVFDESLVVYEDQKFMYDYLKASSKIAYFRDVLYCYVIYASSTMHKLSATKRWQHFKVMNYILGDQNLKTIAVKSRLREQCMDFAWLYLQQDFSKDKNQHEIIAYIKDNYLKTGVLKNTVWLIKIIICLLKK